MWLTPLCPNRYATCQVQIESCVWLLSGVTLWSGNSKYPSSCHGKGLWAAFNCTVLLKSLASSLWLCGLVLFQAMTLLSCFPWVTWRPQKNHQNQPLLLGKFLTEGESGEPGRALEGRNGGICSWLHPIPGLCPWAHPLISPLPSVYPATFFLHTMGEVHDYSSWVCKSITESFLVGGF